MASLAKLLRVFRAYRAGMPLGDVVVMKLDALAFRSPGIAERLASVRGDAPDQDLAALRALPAGTLGREYARFLDANGITPLVIGEATRARFRDDPYALRFTTTHDLHHMLTGFDAGLAGEIGVLGFNVGQGSAPVPRAMLWLACAIYTALSPTQARTLWHNAMVGLRMGRAADLVLAAPLEAWSAEPLRDVRARLRIEDPRAAGVRASGRSFFAELLYQRA